MDKTAFNVTEFIHSSFVYEMLTNSDGLNDRQLFDFPPERELFLDQLQVLMPPETPSLEDIFMDIYSNHMDSKIYTSIGRSMMV